MNFYQLTYRFLKLILLSCLLPVMVCAQKEELHERVKVFDEMNTAKPFRVVCDFSIKGSNITPGTGESTLEYASDGIYRRFKMGNDQLIIEKQGFYLMVFYPAREVIVREDAPVKKMYQPGLDQVTKQISALIDSATFIETSKDIIGLHYLLSFKPGFLYKSIKLSFTEDGKKPKSIYVLLDTKFQEQFAELIIDYKEWYSSWSPESGFPGIDKIIVKKEERYFLGDTYVGFHLSGPNNNKR